VYSLHPNYGELFLYAGETSKERIFTRNYAKTNQASGQNNNIFGEYASPANSGTGAWFRSGSSSTRT
jgi:hypothetical protein